MLARNNYIFTINHEYNMQFTILIRHLKERHVYFFNNTQTAALYSIGAADSN